MFNSLPLYAQVIVWCTALEVAVIIIFAILIIWHKREMEGFHRVFNQKMAWWSEEFLRVREWGENVEARKKAEASTAKAPRENGWPHLEDK